MLRREKIDGKPNRAIVEALRATMAVQTATRSGYSVCNESTGVQFATVKPQRRGSLKNLESPVTMQLMHCGAKAVGPNRSLVIDPCEP